jgi:hypothetical protein
MWRFEALVAIPAEARSEVRARVRLLSLEFQAPELFLKPFLGACVIRSSRRG